MEGSLEQHGRGRPDHLPGRRDAQAPAAVQDGLRDAPRVHDGAKVALLVAGTAQKGDRLGGHRQGERADEQGERHPEREPAACRCALSWLWRHDALGAPRDALRRRRTGGGSARGRGALDACAGACASHYRRGGAGGVLGDARRRSHRLLGRLDRKHPRQHHAGGARARAAAGREAPLTDGHLDAVDRQPLLVLPEQQRLRRLQVLAKLVDVGLV
mmetsp:Transcript_4513/g.13083  ORF Transcript_4513/g.13083 Transcript_4513/m.13083 type:complete len:215 (-) Transcript_4513:100-744(-)